MHMQATRIQYPVLAIAMFVAASGFPAGAQTLEDKVNTLMQHSAKQQAEIDSLRAQLAVKQGASMGEAVAADMHGQILDLSLVDARVAEAVAKEVPGWLDGLVFKGDTRVRYEGQYFEDNEAFPEDRNRGRFRLRFGFEKTWGDDKDWKTAFRLASGTGEAASTNQTFTDFFNAKPVWIDLAYIRYAPAEGALSGLELVGGKMPNPFLTTWNHWDTDVNPEGAFEKYSMKFFGDFVPYANFGQFFLKENSARPDDTSLLVYGGGFDWKLDKDSGLKASFATNYYDYTHVKDNMPPSAAGNIVKMIDGRTFLSAEDFDILDFVFKLGGKAWDVPFELYGNYANNVGIDEDANSPPYDDQWSIGLLLGQNKKKNDLSLEAAYAYNEPNSGYGYFMDSDLGNAGDRGFVLRSFYNLTDFANIGGSAFFIDTFTADEEKDFRSILQLDLSVKF